MYLFVEDEGFGAYAEVQMGHGAIAEAYWKIPESQTGNTWIEAKIAFAGTGAWTPPENGIIYQDVSASGILQVADTYLLYWLQDDGGIHVIGTLMDLDGPHPIDTTFLGAIAELTVRQYMAPGQQFTTYTDHVSNPRIYTWDIYDAYVGAGVVGSTSAQSSDLKAFVGSPD